MGDPQIRNYGDSALLVEFGEGIDPAVNAQVMALDTRLARTSVPGLIETAPSFRSLMVVFDPLETDPARVAAAIRDSLGADGEAEAAGRRWRLPTCYEGDLAPDLSEVAARAGLSPDAVVARHTDMEHSVYMIGFLPGCPYLGDLPSEIDFPRRSDPRLRVPAGAVAIAVGLTVIYPVECPGGWHILGRTPVALFDPKSDPPALLAPGDRVRFAPVGRAEHDRIAAAVAAGEWLAEREARL